VSYNNKVRDLISGGSSHKKTETAMFPSLDYHLVLLITHKDSQSATGNH